MRTWFSFLLLALLALSAQADTSTEPSCNSEQADCVAVGSWQVSVGVGLGVRTNPLIGGDNIPLVLLPSVSYYGERFFFDTTSIGFTLHEDTHSMFNLVATVGLDSMYFSDISLGNFVIEGTGGGFNLGGLGLTSALDGDAAEDLTLAPPVDETRTPNTYDIDGPNEFFHKPELTSPRGEPQTIFVEQIADRKMAGLAGLEYSYSLGATQISVQALQDFTHVHDGQELRFGLDRRWRLGRNQIALAGGFVWQSDRVVDYYYGLGERDVGDASQLYYRAGDAVTPYLRADWLRPVTPNWTLQMTLHQKWLGRSIHRSPLVQDSTSTTVFVGGVYHF
ncbi:MipA/OmpV family protein [Gilvimarinus agarilyticus]|uniref:MipA/OmpV family protein n=1 Tax=unclassified Gilvimarinus TaxID=2642066 RepID=UPI001C088050|nr:MULTISPECIES: MipA/OmpV family protein [unclassified Gilvimarinus]MBU2885071.1 MipA/OmpV family protein [Gilvimarinus agarilyticus]MDO6569968.1 MipA/OmpV family protein [Gilvimarinus sp. 2_MG-2023]MDO6747234.1 MipA/OmpV family protein [Gilvimarinus sp. 1_MG-2023]